MSDAIRLYIVTDDAAAASLAELGLHLYMLPPFVRVLTEMRDIAAIPEGACCIGRWFAWSDKLPSAAMLAWVDRKERGDLGVTQAFRDNLDAWLAKRAEAERLLAHEDAVIGSVAAAVPPVQPVVSEGAARQPMQQRWF